MIPRRFRLLAVLAAFLLALPVVALAGSPRATTRIPVTWSGSGVPTIDGVLDAVEWSKAAHQQIDINSATGVVQGDLYVMNDNLNLYIALRFPESVPTYADLAVEFDNNNNGVPFEQGDDVYVANNRTGVHDDFRTYLPPCNSTTVSCAPEDTSAGGTNEGLMAYHNDGVYSVFETSHPMHSGDVGHDISIGFPPSATVVGFFVDVTIVDGGTAYHTFYPGLGVYDQIKTQALTPGTLSGCGIATMDAVISPGEWANAGKFRLSIDTKANGPVPATVYAMNDSFNLYTALVFDPSPQPANLTFVSYVFDTTRDGKIWLGDDLIWMNVLSHPPFDDQVYVPCNYPICTDSDTKFGGTIDGSGALVNTAASTVIEMSHPLNSGDPNDMAFAYGDSIAFQIAVVESGSGAGFPKITVFPDPLAQIVVCKPAPSSAVTDLAHGIDVLVASNIVNPTDADNLQKTLNKAAVDLRIGRREQAAKDLGKFTDEVSKLVGKRRLALRDAQPLITAANNAIAQL